MTAHHHERNGVSGIDSGVNAEQRPSAAPGRKIKVLFINDTARNGGPGRTLFYILKFLDPKVVHRSVVVPREGVVSALLRDGGVVEDLFFEPNLVENPIEPWTRAMVRADFRAPLALRGVRLLGNIARGASAFARLSAQIRREHYDLVFCNGTTANFAGGGLGWSTDIPVLWHVFYSSVPAALSALHARLAASPRVASIACVSEPTSRLFAHCRHKVRVFHDGIDTEEFSRAAVRPRLRDEFGLGRDVVIFGSQGRIVPRKGYLEMVRAARTACDALTEPERRRCRFVVLGDTPQDMQPDHLEECRTLVRSLGLEQNFYFVGYLADVKPYVRDFDVAVVPSVYQDPLPRAVLESMAFELPVLAFDVGGMSEMVENNVCGALVSGSPPDVPGLAWQFVRYFRDAELRRKQGRAARARVTSRFDAKTHARLLQEEMVRVARSPR